MHGGRPTPLHWARWVPGGLQALHTWLGQRRDHGARRYALQAALVLPLLPVLTMTMRAVVSIADGPPPAVIVFGGLFYTVLTLFSAYVATMGLCMPPGRGYTYIPECDFYIRDEKLADFYLDRAVYASQKQAKCARRARDWQRAAATYQARYEQVATDASLVQSFV